ncbi:1907_t:CDS:2, partial [Ambispora leptoticha]
FLVVIFFTPQDRKRETEARTKERMPQGKMRKQKLITYQELKEFVSSLDTSNIELKPQELSLNEIAVVSHLLTLHSEGLINRARVIKGKGDLDRELEKFKSFQQGDFNKGVQDGEHYAIENIVRLHVHEKADFGVAGALDFIIGVLRGLVKNAVPAMVDFANTIMDQLEDRIVDLYNRADEAERQKEKTPLEMYNELKVEREKERKDFAQKDKDYQIQLIKIASKETEYRDAVDNRQQTGEGKLVQLIYDVLDDQIKETEHLRKKEDLDYKDFKKGKELQHSLKLKEYGNYGDIFSDDLSSLAFEKPTETKQILNIKMRNIVNQDLGDDNNYNDEMDNKGAILKEDKALFRIGKDATSGITHAEIV